MTWKECVDDPARCRNMKSTNWYGYPAHFDLQDFHYQISEGLGWLNGEVTFEPVPCSRWEGPSWDCFCREGAGQYEDPRNMTPVNTTTLFPKPVNTTTLFPEPVYTATLFPDPVNTTTLFLDP